MGCSECIHNRDLCQGEFRRSSGNTRTTKCITCKDGQPVHIIEQAYGIGTRKAKENWARRSRPRCGPRGACWPAAAPASPRGCASRLRLPHLAAAPASPRPDAALICLEDAIKGLVRSCGGDNFRTSLIAVSAHAHASRAAGSHAARLLEPRASEVAHLLLDALRRASTVFECWPSPLASIGRPHWSALRAAY